MKWKVYLDVCVATTQQAVRQCKTHGPAEKSNFIGQSLYLSEAPVNWMKSWVQLVAPRSWPEAMATGGCFTNPGLKGWLWRLCLCEA